MTQEQFNEMCSEMRRLWTPGEGLVVEIDAADGNVDRLVVGPLTNNSLVAEKCVLWSGGSKAYEGVIRNPELLGKLQSRGAKELRYTTSKRLGRKHKRYMSVKQLETADA